MGILQSAEWVYLLTALILVLLSGFFSASEIGLLSVNRFRLHQLVESGIPHAQLLHRMLLQPARPLTVILILITALNYINESLITYWLHVIHGFPEWVPFVTLLITLLIFAEVTPISYAAANLEIVALRAAPIVAFVTTVMHPILAILTAIANLVLRLFGGKPLPRPLVTGEEVRTIVDIETERGVLEEEEKELIHSIFEFSDTIVREIMVPRIDVIAVADTTTIGEVIDMTIAHRFSRLPVYQGNLDHIIGLVHIKNLLPYELTRQTNLPVSQAMRPVTFVPETKGVSELLQEFRETKTTLAIVIDEYGGTAGLVTVEDLLEEIVGEIYDEYDIEQKLVEWIDANTVLVDGKFSIYELRDLLNHEIPEGEYDTVGGLLYSRFGDVPARGESVMVHHLQFIVERLDGHRIAKVRVIITPPKQTPEREA